MRRAYITESEYEEAEYRIYNDLPVFMAEDLSKIRSKFNQKVAERLTIEGEQYIQVEGKEHYILTSYGRLINTYSVRIIQPYISRTNIHWPLNDVHINCKRDFSKFGWKYDYEELVKRYVDNQWPCRPAVKALKKLFI